MTNIDFKVDQSKCIQCKLCAADCPVLIIDAKTPFPEIKANKEDQCIKCQHCLAVCPTAALSIWGKQPEDSVVVNDQTPAPAAMEQLIKTRRSTRKFKPEQLEQVQIRQLLATAAYAPTSKNENGILFTIVEDQATMAKVRALTYDNIRKKSEAGQLEEPFAFLDNFQAVWHSKQIDILFRGAPHLLIASASKKTLNPKTDSVIALSYFELLANSHGIGTLWNGFAKWAIDDIGPEIRKMIGIPDDHLVAEVLIFGKPAIKYYRSVQSEGLHLNLVVL